jgi:amino acid adenylation domain-containing protein
VAADILAVASRHPERPAVIAGGTAVDYATLVERACRVANEILAGAVPGRGVDAVAVCTDRTPWYISSVIGAWLAGRPFVPLDTTLPPHRQRQIIATAEVEVCLAPAAVHPLRQLRRVTTPLPAATRRCPAGIGEPALPAPDDRAYILFTSGSTGQPKGVAVRHGSLAATIAAFRQPELAVRPVGLATTPFTFDVSLFELFFPLVTGGTLVLADETGRADPDTVASLIDGHRVGWVTQTPTWLRLLSAVQPRCLSGVLVISIGEVLDAELARKLAANGAVLWNAYGPTETTIYSTLHKVTNVEAVVPIGTPLPGELALVLDEQGRECPPGVPGMLWIGGTGVAEGYVNAPDLTAAAFRNDPVRGRVYRTGDRVTCDTDGVLRFVGRDDDQVKIRGHRIELGELETWARRHHQVRQSAAWVSQHPVLGPQIVLAVHTGGQAGSPPASLRSFLADHLPDYMHPSRVVHAAEWPLNSSGKTDKHALRTTLDTTGAMAPEGAILPMP